MVAALAGSARQPHIGRKKRSVKVGTLAAGRRAAVGETLGAAQYIQRVEGRGLAQWRATPASLRARPGPPRPPTSPPHPIAMPLPAPCAP